MSCRRRSRTALPRSVCTRRFKFDRCHNFFLPTVRKKKLKRSVVHLLSKVKMSSTKQAEKYRKTLNFKWNRVFLVEISGIEPLTSWMPFAPWQVCHSANGGFSFKTINFCNLLHIVFWVYFNLLSKLLSKTFGQQRYSRTHQSFKYATPCFISKRGTIRLCTSFEYLSNELRWCGGNSIFAALWSRFFLFLYAYIIVLL